LQLRTGIQKNGKILFGKLKLQQVKSFICQDLTKLKNSSKKKLKKQDL
jgi:hypothetical protein